MREIVSNPSEPELDVEPPSFKMPGALASVISIPNGEGNGKMGFVGRSDH
jgi:hypothetical protein